MSIPTINNFMCCMSLRMTTTGFAMVFSFIDKTTDYLIHQSHLLNNMNHSKFPLILIYVVTSISIITTILMIIGSAKNNTRLMFPFLIFGIIDYHVTAVTTFWGIFLLFLDHVGYGCLALLLGLLTLAFGAYFWIAVYSRIKEITENINEALIPDDGSHDDCF